MRSARAPRELDLVDHNNQVGRRIEPQRERGRGSPRSPEAIAEFVPGFELDGFYSFVAPAHTPSPLVNALGTEIARTLQTPSIRDRLAIGGLVVSVEPPAAFAEFLRQQIDKYAALARRTGITLD